MQEHPELPVIVLTGANDVETAVRCMKDGAFDYLLKPVDEARLESAVRRAIEIGAMRRENSTLKRYLLTDALEHPEAFAAIVTAAKSMRAIFQYAEAVAPTPLPILVTGETGVGKELIARAIHAPERPPGPFLPVNVAGLDDALFSDALFGHKRGGFTGADRDRPGLVEQAAGGTLFLDEIGDLSPASQVKLLRLLQEGTYYPIGSDVMKRADIRVLVATNRDLRALQASGGFRKDLYYRLQAHHLHLPPLRERREDLPLLVAHFLAEGGPRAGPPRPDPAARAGPASGAVPLPRQRAGAGGPDLRRGEPAPLRGALPADLPGENRLDRGRGRQPGSAGGGRRSRRAALPRPPAYPEAGRGCPGPGSPAPGGGQPDPGRRPAGPVAPRPEQPLEPRRRRRQKLRAARDPAAPQRGATFLPTCHASPAAGRPDRHETPLLAPKTGP